jgi:hypothetical protein
LIPSALSKDIKFGALIPAQGEISAWSQNFSVFLREYDHFFVNGFGPVHGQHLMINAPCIYLTIIAQNPSIVERQFEYLPSLNHLV